MADEAVTLRMSRVQAIVGTVAGIVSIAGALFSLTPFARAVNTGELVATVGVVGRSSGPHLHWSNRIAPGQPTKLALFQVPGKGSCYEPQEGDDLTSNNKP